MCVRSGSAIYRMERRAPPTSDVDVVSTAHHPRLATVLDKLREVKTQLGTNVELTTALQQALETQSSLMRSLIQAHREIYDQHTHPATLIIRGAYACHFDESEHKST